MEPRLAEDSCRAAVFDQPTNSRSGRILRVSERVSNTRPPEAANNANTRTNQSVAELIDHSAPRDGLPARQNRPI
ncbi:hypothetical protein E2C01_036521 [Portunus trituberculatus]|uniref:Uncharacterized protein n=1 Tax=Portunus trituberculatus TaxID=210409 RepID=A0A5B7F5U2_PORTR|nr:hypothetical protein [Portunus trituberculatus]